MARLKIFLLLLAFLLLYSEAKRFGGFGRSASKVGKSSWASSIFGRKSPKINYPSVQRPIGFVNPKTSQPFKPPVYENAQRSVVRQTVSSSVTQRPIGFVDPSNPNRALGSGTSLQQDRFKPSAPKDVPGTQRPIGFVNSHDPYKPSAPKEVHEAGNQQKSVNNAYGAGYNPSAPNAPYGNSQQPGYGNSYQQGGYHPQSGYGNSYQQGGYHPQFGNSYQQGGYGYNHQNDYSNWYRQPHTGGGGFTNINYGPVNYGYPSSPTYHYTSSDYGSGTLGFFLGYGLGRLTSPSYYHQNYYPDSGYHYDHYTIHHYYHNKDTVPQQLSVPPNTVVACVGNSSLLCPPNTVALCMSNGTIMCVAKPETLIRCPNNSNAYCVQSAIPELNSTTSLQKNQTTIVNIPCISNATLYGNLTYQNNSIVLQDTRNLTISNNATDLTSDSKPVVFCITVIAEPAVKKPDAAVLYEKIKGNTLHFFTRAFGVD